MTALGSRSSAPETSPAPEPLRAVPPRRWADDPTLPATLALLGVTLAAALGLARLFATGRFALPVVAAAVVAHAVTWAGRRARLTGPVAAVLLLVATGATIAWVLFPATTVYGIPGGATVHAVTGSLRSAWQQFGSVVAPAKPTDGFVAGSMLGVALGAGIADWSAFRVRGIVQPIVPSLSLFVFTATLGGAHLRTANVASYFAAVLVFVLVHHTTSGAAASSWFASRTTGGLPSAARTGVAFGAVAIVAAVTIGPHVPGASHDPIISWRDQSQAGSRGRTTVSPLIDIRGRLVDPSAVDVFTVASNVRSYWRLMALDSFDGNIWSSNNSYVPVRRKLPGDVPSTAPAEHAVQDFAVSGLASIWLPAAFRPVRVEGVDHVRFDDDSASLITDAETSDGVRYRVESDLSRLTARGLAGAGVAPPAPALRRYLEVPAVPAPVSDLAHRIAAQAGSGTYARARALQDYLRKNYRYDLRVPAGHGDDALVRFLFQTRRGYCEQFAGAYAVLARVMQLPTRVAVGFTPGERGADGRFHVRALHAHAWPEVYLESFGWVAFEPTPGRGMPGAQDYTGVPETQADPADLETATTVAPAPPTTAAAPGAAPTTTLRDDRTDLGTAPASNGRSRAGRVLVAALVALAAVIAAWTAGVPLALQTRRRRRRAAASGNGPRVLVAWIEAEEALARTHVIRSPAETLAEFARRAPGDAALGREASAALQELASLSGRAAYASAELAPAAVERAVTIAGTVERALADGAPWWRRASWVLDPRPLVPRSPEHEVRTRPPAPAPA